MSTSGKRPSRNEWADDARLRELQAHGTSLLAEFEGNFTVPYRLTLVARNPDRPNGGLDVVITDDDAPDLLRAIQRRLPGSCGSEDHTGLFVADRIIAIAAFRYALGRMTTVPSHVVEWLIAHKATLSRADRELIVREIDEAADQKRLGMDIDVVTWSRLRDAVDPASVGAA